MARELFAIVFILVLSSTTDVWVSLSVSISLDIMVAWVDLFHLRLMLLAVLVFTVLLTVATFFFDAMTFLFELVLALFFTVGKLLIELESLFFSLAGLVMLSLGQLLGISLIFGESGLVLFGSVAHRHVALIGHMGVVLSEVLAVISVLAMRDMGIVIRVDSACASSSVLLLRVVIVFIVEPFSVRRESMLVVSLPL